MEENIVIVQCVSIMGKGITSSLVMGADMGKETSV